MRKEISIALLAGITLGLVIAFGIWKSNANSRQAEKTATPQEKIQPTEEKTPSPTAIEGLTVLKPEDNEVITADETDLEGITEPQALVVISTEKEDYLVKADNQGGFSLKIPLISGVNEIDITSYPPGKEAVSLALLLVSSKEFQK